jgi:hypothetical protein
MAFGKCWKKPGMVGGWGGGVNLLFDVLKGSIKSYQIVRRCAGRLKDSQVTKRSYLVLEKVEVFIYRSLYT